MRQEPGTSEEIKQFAKSFNVQFDMFEKVEVNGSNAHPLWVYLKAKQGGLLGMCSILRLFVNIFLFSFRRDPGADFLFDTDPDAALWILFRMQV